MDQRASVRVTAFQGGALIREPGTEGKAGRVARPEPFA
jgi:hypothetical protein